MLRLFFIYSRDKDFQLANSADNIATAIWDMVFLALNKALKQLSPHT